jgi:hypothetical protein
LAIRIIFILGFINVVAGIILFFSCRCLPGAAIGRNLMKHPKFQKFYRYHCYLWWVLWPSVIAHAVLVFIYLGLPF